MNIFCHISEFGPEGMQLVPSMAFVSERLTLWAPAHGLVQEAQHRGHSFLGPDDLLALVENGHLQVMVRRRWLTDRKYRASVARVYPLAAWVEEYDGRLRAIAREDEGRLQEDRRVLFAPKADGEEWAEAVLASSDPEDVSRVTQVWALYRSGRYPVGTRQKLERVKGSGEAARVLLAYVRNHTKAFEDAGADRLALLSDEADIYARTLPMAARPAEKSRAKEDAGRLLELLQLLCDLSRPRNSRELHQLLERDDRKQLLVEAKSLLASDTPAYELLLDQIRAGTPSKPALLGDTVIDRHITASGLLLALSSWEFAPSPILGIISALAAPGYRALRREGLVSLPDYSGPSLPFALAFNKTQPTYREIAHVVGRLLEQLQKPSE